MSLGKETDILVTEFVNKALNARTGDSVVPLANILQIVCDRGVQERSGVLKAIKNACLDCSSAAYHQYSLALEYACHRPQIDGNYMAIFALPITIRTNKKKYSEISINPLLNKHFDNQNLVIKSGPLSKCEIALYPALLSPTAIMTSDPTSIFDILKQMKIGFDHIGLFRWPVHLPFLQYNALKVTPTYQVDRNEYYTTGILLGTILAPSLDTVHDFLAPQAAVDNPGKYTRLAHVSGFYTDIADIVDNSMWQVDNSIEAIAYDQLLTGQAICSTSYVFTLKTIIDRTIDSLNDISDVLYDIRKTEECLSVTFDFQSEDKSASRNVYGSLPAYMSHGMVNKTIQIIAEDYAVPFRQVDFNLIAKKKAKVLPFSPIRKVAHTC